MKYSNKLHILTENLRKSEKVNYLDKVDERESDTLAHSLLDIEESCNILLNDLLPRLMVNNIVEASVDEILLDIGEEFRHILYHIKDPNFYEYLEGKPRSSNTFCDGLSAQCNEKVR